MNRIATPCTELPRGAALATIAPERTVALGLLLLLAVTAAAWWITRNAAGGVAMWTIAGAQFILLKLTMLRGHTAAIAPRRIGAFLALWVGMDAKAFLAPAGPTTTPTAATPHPSLRELAFAFTKLALGVAFLTTAVRLAGERPTLLVVWVGMLGIIFTLHFGAFHIVSWFWRCAGVTAAPIMRAPIAATSLAELWGERWNLAFADAARRLWLRPLARRWGVRPAAWFVFFMSGVIHETVISLPAGGGWGGPLAYFLIQGAGAALEKSALGRRLGLGAGVRGWGWTLLIAAAPIPLLFHEPFAERVVAPMFVFLKEVL